MQRRLLLMKRVLIVYYSHSGHTEKMAEYIAEGVRFSGHEALVKNIEDTKLADLAGYDGYIFGSPTYSLDVPGPMKAFLQTAETVDTKGKLGGAFGPYTHDVGYSHEKYAPAILFDSLQRQHKMEPFELGPFSLQEDSVDTSQGMETCQDYGRVFGQKLGG
jgi:flavodoxin